MIQLNLLFKLELRAKLLYFIVLLWIVIRLASIKNQFMRSTCKLLRYSSSYRDGRFITQFFLIFRLFETLTKDHSSCDNQVESGKTGKKEVLEKSWISVVTRQLMTNTSSAKMHNFFGLKFGEIHCECKI